MMLTVGSLFAGIGGFDLGFERCGMRTVWQVEQNDFCRAVLAQHFPDAQRFVDVREVGTHNLAPVDLICGGFPCQDLSLAGRGAGIDGEHSGLWAEFARIIGELRPRYVVVENVPALTRNEWLGRVLGDLAACGYDAEWDCLPASAFGAPHRRDRIWLIAYPQSAEGRRGAFGGSSGDGRPCVHGEAGVVADPDESGGDGGGSRKQRGAESQDGSDGRGIRSDDAAGAWWAAEPNVGRVADGIPSRVDRLAALGNALVPQIAEWIGSRILDFEEGSSE